MTTYRSSRFARFQDDYARLNQFAALMRMPAETGTFLLAKTAVNGPVVQMADGELLGFSGFDYLGLGQHPAVTEAAREAIARYGTTAAASLVCGGQTDLHTRLEERLAAFLGTEAAMTFNSGFSTNASTIGFLFDEHDLVLHDALMHASAVEGARTAGAKRIAFPHNDVAALETLLAEHRGRHPRVLVLIEGAYSMDGDIAPLREIVDLKTRHDFFLMVDEAHSLGTLGTTGRGIAEHWGVPRGAVDIWMGTLSKALASVGGYIAGPRVLINHLRFGCPGFLFSTGLPPASAAAADAALALLEAEPQRARQLQQRVAAAQRIALSMGLDIGTASHAPILPVILKDRDLTWYASFALHGRRIGVHPLSYPACAKDQARLRFFITLAHSEAQIEHALAQVVQVVLEGLEVGRAMGRHIPSPLAAAATAGAAGA